MPNVRCQIKVEANRKELKKPYHLAHPYSLPPPRPVFPENPGPGCSRMHFLETLHGHNWEKESLSVTRATTFYGWLEKLEGSPCGAMDFFFSLDQEPKSIRGKKKKKKNSVKSPYSCGNFEIFCKIALFSRKF